MTPSQRPKYGCEAGRNVKWRSAAPPNVPSLKRPGGVPQPWPINTHPTGQVHRSHLLHPPPPSSLPPHLPLFHTRHAEESAERPHLVTIVRPGGQSSLRKVTVLLNRRGVVSFEQLLLDISEALGFPRWHRARVTRLYTTHAREVKGVCDFFRGEVAFLALGKSRPDLSFVHEALEELFPDHSHYRADALRSWEKRLNPAPDKAAKADSGYSEGADSVDANQDTHRHGPDAHVNHPASRQSNGQRPDGHRPEGQRSHKKSHCRKPAHLPNHLQRLHVRGQPSVMGPFRYEDSVGEAEVFSPTLCENCLAIRATHQGAERVAALSGRVPLPPVLSKQKNSSHPAEERKADVPPRPHSPQPISRDEERSLVQLQPPPDVGSARQATTFDLPSDGSNVTLSDIERCYELGRAVGDGNFAVVRECRRRDDGQALAMKIVERSKLIGREHMMQNELSLLGSLCHRRIVRLFAHHHTCTHSYLVMELVSGGDLFEAISERGKFPEAEAGLMVSDMSDALSYIHAKSIVHRDLKPENLLIEHMTGGVCRLKLGDFGLAMVVTEPVFTICGTPTYVAPEILSETGYGVAVDIWAMGVILYILLCGFPPFRSRDRDQEELFQLIKQGEMHFLSPYWDPISEEAKGLVRALLQPDPTARLTAEQSVLHPWVEAMAAVYKQGVLTDNKRRSGEDGRAEAESVLRAARANATETCRTHESQSEKKGQAPQQQQQQQQSSNATHLTPTPQIKVHTATEDEPRQQIPDRTSTPSRPQSPGREVSITEGGTGQTTTPEAEPIRPDQVEPLAQIHSQSKQSMQQQQAPPDPPHHHHHPALVSPAEP